MTHKEQRQLKKYNKKKEKLIDNTKTKVILGTMRRSPFYGISLCDVILAKIIQFKK